MEINASNNGGSLLIDGRIQKRGKSLRQQMEYRKDSSQCQCIQDAGETEQQYSAIVIARKARSFLTIACCSRSECV